jgi:hypothetical protein
MSTTYIDKHNRRNEIHICKYKKSIVFVSYGKSGHNHKQCHKKMGHRLCTYSNYNMIDKGRVSHVCQSKEF